MVNIIIDDSPWIFLYQPMQFGLIHNWIRNYEPHAFPYGMSKYRGINDNYRSIWKEYNEKSTIDLGGISKCFNIAYVAYYK